MTAAGDVPLKSLRRAETFTDVVRACPLQAHWLDGETLSGRLDVAGELGDATGFSRLAAELELELPALAVAGHAPDFEGTEFSDASLEPHRHNVSHLAIEFQSDVQRAAFLDIVTPVFQKAADLVLLTYAGT